MNRETFITEMKQIDLDCSYVTYRPIDKSLFSYHTDELYIYLHMTYDLKDLIQMYSASKVRKFVNLQLLKAIEYIINLMDQGDKRFKDKKYLYMLSPLLFGKTELDFLKKLGFETKSFKRGDLKKEEYVNRDIDAQVAVCSFGIKYNIGMALIPIDEIKLSKYKKIADGIIKELGTTLLDVEKIVETMTQRKPCEGSIEK